MEKIKVKNIMIGKQFQTCENYQQFLKVVNEKKIKVCFVEAGQRIAIEKGLYFDVLWPSLKDRIYENSINNNSLVCKMTYHNFSILFTGDIEEVAEKAIISKYDTNIEVLKSTVLKVAHHGSKSSSVEEFVHFINPKIALIGVGKKNTFGHPNNGVLERLEQMRK